MSFIEHLKSLCTCCKPVFVTYGYENLKTWGEALQKAVDKKNEDEWKNVITHLSNYSCITGLILDHLDVEVRTYTYHMLTLYILIFHVIFSPGNPFQKTCLKI